MPQPNRTNGDAKPEPTTGEKIRARREERELTQGQLASQMGLKKGQGRISEFEMGVRYPSKKTLDRIVEVLNSCEKARGKKTLQRKDLVGRRPDQAVDEDSEPEPAQPPVIYPPLPPKPAICLGRDKEINDCRDKLTASEPQPCLACRGLGGFGKSTIALWLLHDPAIIAHYGHHRHFVSLESATNRSTVVLKIAEAISEPLGDYLEQRVLRKLAEVTRFLVLDNAETPLTDPTARDDVLELFGLIAAIPTLGGLMTLRPGLPVDGWTALDELKEFDLDAARETFHYHSGRAYAKEAQLDLDALLEKLGRWPLCVKILARQAARYPRLKDLSDDWDRERSKLLAKGSERRDSDLGACVAISLNDPRIGESEKQLLGVLALLPDGIHWNDLDRLMPGTGSKAGGNLREIGGLTRFDGAKNRLIMPPPLRDYLTGILKIAPAVLQKVIAFYCGRTAELGVKLGRESGAEAVRQIGEELGNLEAMIRRGLQAPAIDVACRGAVGLGEYGSFVGVDVRPLLEESIEAARRNGNQRLLADCVYASGRLSLYRSSYSIASARFIEARKLYRAEKDRLGEASCIQRLGEIALRQGDYTTARDKYNEARPIHQAVEDRLGEANCIQGLGDIALRQGDYTTARDKYNDALPIYQAVGDRLGEANCIQRLGDIALRQGDYPTARDQFNEARPIFRSVENCHGQANCSGLIGRLDELDGNRDSAIKKYHLALKNYSELHDKESIGAMHWCLARIAVDPIEKADHIAKAREAWRDYDPQAALDTWREHFPDGHPEETIGKSLKSDG